MIFLSFISLFNVGGYDEYVINVDNKNMDFGTSVVNNKPISINTQKTEIPLKIVDTKKETKVDAKTNEKKETIVPSSEKVKEAKTLEMFTGRMTGYGADCAGCSKVGNVACRTKTGTKHSLTNDGMYYTDDQYGKVRIVAAAREKFPCGTIVEIIKSGQEPITAVVLDTGGSMNSAYAKDGTIWFDLAYVTQADAKVGGVSGFNYQFNVKRWGW